MPPSQDLLKQRIRKGEVILGVLAGASMGCLRSAPYRRGSAPSTAAACCWIRWYSCSTSSSVKLRPSA